MKKSIKNLLTSLLIMGTVVNVGCSQKAKEEVQKEIDTKIEQTFTDNMNKNNGDVEKIREAMTEFCEEINREGMPWSMTFRIDKKKNEIRVAIISKNKTNKITDKEEIAYLHFQSYDLLTMLGYEGKVFTDIGVYNKTDNEYSIYYTYNYDKNGNGVLNPVKNVMTESELFDFYNH